MTTSEARQSCAFCGTLTASDSLTCPTCGRATAPYPPTSDTLQPDAGKTRQTAPLEIGRQIGHFRLTGLLGAGGFATVYRADDLRLGRQVALKLLHPHLVANPTFLHRFEQEARAAARLRHRHIVTIYEVGETAESQPYIVMELLEGKLLSHVIAAEAPLPFEAAAPLIWQLALALDYLHGQGLVHRDLKPANVMVGAAGVTLLDFGIAHALGDGAGITGPGEIVGTPIYMAPEQFGDSPVGPPADVYALGVVAYELFAGRPPFTGTTHAVMRAQYLETAPPPLSSFNPQVAGSAAEAILQALAKDPLARPVPAIAFVEHLAAGAGGAGGHVDSWRATDESLRPNADAPTRRPTPQERGSRAQRVLAFVRRNRLVAGLLALGLVLALAGWLVTGAWSTNTGGQLEIDSSPEGATVAIDDQAVGQTPLRAPPLRPGDHTVLLTKPTYEDLRQTVLVGGQQRQTIRPALKSKPLSQLLTVTRAAIAIDYTRAADGSVELVQEAPQSDRPVPVTAGSGGPSVQIRVQVPPSQVRASRQFVLVVTLAPTYPHERDLDIQYRFELQTSDGGVQSQSSRQPLRLSADTVQGRQVSYPLALPPNNGPSDPAGVYRLRLLVNDEELVAEVLQVIP